MDKAYLMAIASIERGDKDALLTALYTLDVNVKNEVGQTLLHKAAGRHGSAEIAEVLIHRGVDVNSRDHEGATALLFAVDWQRMDVVEVILDAGGRLDIGDEYENEPLWYAVGGPRPDCALIELLMKRGANATHKNKYGRTPLEIARQRNREQIVRILEGKVE